MSQGEAPPVEHPILAALAVLERGAAALVAANTWSLSDADLAVALDRWAVVTAQLAAGGLNLVGDADSRNMGVSEAADTAGWMRGRLLMHPGDAKRTVRLANSVRGDCAATGAAFGRGAFSVAHAKVIVHAITHLPPVEADIKAQAEAFLIEQAQVLDPLLLRRAAEALTETLTTGPDADERLLRDIARREFTGVTAADGMVRVRGWLDREAWAQFSAVLDPLAAPCPAADGTPDPRSAARRRGDALPELARLAANATMPRIGGVAPTLTVTIGHDALAGRIRAAGLLNTGEPISAGAARRIGCDAQLIPVVLGSAGQPLDIGRAARIVPPPMRRALIVRDEACAFPGCDRPAAWSEAHHLVHWADGGITALDNLVLLCLAHHHAVHHHGWTVSLDGDGLPTFHPPPWIDPDQTPRQHHRYTLRRTKFDLTGRDPPDDGD